MSFEDIEVARAAPAAKDVIKGKGKRGRKRKSAAQEADNRCASAMEGTSCEDDMRLLHERIENRFSFPLVQIWFYGGRKSDTINVRSILGVIGEDGVMVCLQVISKKSLCRGQTLN